MSTDKQPSYSQICRRTNKLDITSNRLDDDDEDDEGIIIAIDSTGIKVTNRGQWMQDKWNIGKRGYLKIHVAVDINTRELLALEVTDEKLHDERKIMEHLVIERVLENKNIQIKSVLADDGAYDSNRNFKYLQKKKIQPGIKVKKNSIISCKNNKIRNREVSSQIKDLFKWKKKRKYGHRWMAKEIVFSSIKRMFGEYVSAIRIKNMINEMMIKVSLNNFFRRLA